MNIKLFTNGYATTLKEAIQRQEKRQEVIARNIAHAEDPTYQKENSDFSVVLDKTIGQSRLKTTNNKHITHAISKTITRVASNQTQNNEVDLTEEMVSLTENQIRYDFTTSALGRYYRGLSDSIVGRN
ncbi:MAG: flagellar basal body rod protein FlgB [Fidelibacterota bacterium]